LILSFAIAPALAQDSSPDTHDASAQPKAAAGGAQDLQKATQNPVASLISVPVQNNSNFDIGPFNRTQNVLNIQPVIPVKASEKWSLIIRWITPIIWQPAPGTTNLESLGIEENTPAFLLGQGVQNSAGVFGFGDMNPHFSCRRPNRGSLSGAWGRHLCCRPPRANFWDKANSVSAHRS
jgi:hypothetical protein